MRLADSVNLLARIDRVEVERRLEFAALPEGWAAVGMLALAAGLCWVIVWMYRHEGRGGASHRVRLFMAGVRCLVMLALLTIWLEPVLATFLHRWIDSYTVVLVDTSSSMDLQDRYRRAEDIERVRAISSDAGKKPLRRIDLSAEIIRRDQHRFLRDLTAHNRVKVHTFAEAPQAVFTLRAAREADFKQMDTTADASETPLLNAGANDSLPTEFSAQGAATNVARAVRQSVEALDRSPIAGVVLLTDGGINQGDSADAVARYARDKKIPLHIIGIGDPSPPRNVRVAEVIAPDNVFAEDPFAVVVQLTGQGVTGESVSLELLERRADSGGEARVVATRSVTLGPDNTVEPITFEHRQGALGRYVYQARVPVGDTESVADDNSKQITVHVIENKLRVLLIAGAPSWEYRYLSRLLTRDTTFELSCWLQSADVDAVRDGNVIIDHLPATAEELFEYDAVVLLDPDPLEFTADFAELLTTLVTQHGGGLLYAAARLHAPGFMRDAAAADVVRILPVSPDPDADLVLNQIGHYQLQGHPLMVPAAAAGHPAMRLPGDEGSAYTWSGIGEVYWHFPVLREKPVATVLMRHGDTRMQNAYGQHVLLATQYAGSGRTAFLGTDATWRWRTHSEEAYNRFWVRMIRYLVEGKLAGGNRRGTLLTENETYQLGEVVHVTARLFDRSFEPLQAPEVQATYQLGDEKGEFTLRRVNDRPGWYEAGFVPPRTGGCELLLPIPGGEMAGDVARREIQIVRPNLEIQQPQLNRERLVALAEQSEGGRYYDINQAWELPRQIPDRHESTTIRSRPTPLWDDAWVLIVLVALLNFEWAMRHILRML